MPQNTRIEKILVISANDELTAIVKAAAGESFEIIRAANQQQGLEMARKEFVRLAPRQAEAGRALGPGATTCPRQCPSPSSRRPCPERPGGR